jgi:hypothetical protein
MRTIGKVAEEEMVAVFLQAEISSARFGSTILRLLEEDEVERKVIDRPCLTNEVENAYRADFLGKFRGYKKDRGIFHGFPNDVEWQRASLTREDLEQVRYIDWDYWSEISGDTRLVLDAANRIKRGMIDEAEALSFRSAAAALRQGEKFPELILVGRRQGSDLVLLEGHVRLTGYLLEPDCLPREMIAIVGYSNHLDEWKLY